MRTEQEPDDHSTLLSRALIALVAGVCRAPWLVLGLALAGCAISTYLSCTQLKFYTQRSDLISQNKDYQQRWKAYLKEFGDDDDMVVVVQGKDRAQMEKALEHLAAQVGQHPNLLDRLFYKVDLRSLHNRALLFLPDQQIGQIQAKLGQMKDLLEPPFQGLFGKYTGWQTLSVQRLVHRAQERAAELQPGQELSADDLMLFNQVSRIVSVARQSLEDPKQYRNPWLNVVESPSEQKDLMAEPQYFFSGDGSLAFLLVRPVKEKDSFTAAQKSVDQLHALVANTGKQFPSLTFGLTGLPVLENDEMNASQSDTNMAGWLALAGVALLYLVVYRNIGAPLLTVSALLVGTSWALGWLTLTVGHLNILSSTFAVMLIGMGDYGVLWVTRYEQERRAGVGVLDAMRATAGSVGPGILTAAVATALAFFAAMLADFQAVAELGWIAGCGILLCAFSTFVVIPAALILLDRKGWDRLLRRTVAAPVNLGTNALTPRPLAWLPALASRPRWVIGASVLATVILAFFASRIKYDHNLLHLQAEGLESVKWEMTLIKHTAGASWHALSYTGTPEEALALKARYEKLPGVSRVVEVASLVPPEQERKLPRLADIQNKLKNLPPRGETQKHFAPRLDDLCPQVEKLHETLAPLARGDKYPILSALTFNLERFNQSVAALHPILAAERLKAFEEVLARDLADDLHRLKDVAAPQSIQVTDLPPSLRERYIGQNGKWLLRVFAKDCLWEYGPLKDFVREIRTVDGEATGKPFSTLEGLRSMKYGFLYAGLYAFIAIVLVLLLDFRDIRQTLVALAPLVMGMVVSLGLLALFGWSLNPANMIAFPLILGVGADNGVHVLHDYLGRNRKEKYTLGRTTGRGILVAALTTILGFGTLMISHHRGLFGLGLILTLGVTCCMMTALVFLPAALRLLSMRGQPAMPVTSIPLPKDIAAAA